MYTKTRGHHCWWLRVNGKEVANFDDKDERLIDEIISLHEATQMCANDLYSPSGKIKKKTSYKLMALCQKKVLNFP